MTCSIVLVHTILTILQCFSQWLQIDFLVLCSQIIWCFSSYVNIHLCYLYVFRYNIPELAKKHKVYAIDLLGFGWSDKALIEYDAMVWRDQVVDFLKEVVKVPAIVVGNR